MSQANWDTNVTTLEEAHRESQRREKRLSILRVAAQAFNAGGFYQTSLNKIAKELNVTKPTLYYYVKNKDDILDGILAIAIAQFRAMIADVEASQSSGMMKLRRFFLRYAELVTDDFGTCLILMRTNAPEEKFRQPYHELSAEVFQSLQTIINNGMSDGSIGRCDPKFMASALLGTLNETVYWHQVGKGSAMDSAEKFLIAFSSGLAPRLD